jgi:hypothetical protein
VEVYVGYDIVVLHHCGCQKRGFSTSPTQHA